MIHFIAIYPFVALLLVVFVVLLVVLFIGGILKEATLHNEPPVIEPRALIDPEFPCSWCQVEQAIKAQPHESHGICKRHTAQLLAESKRLNHAA